MPSTSPRVGMIGLGSMGRPLALRLLRAGFALTVHDVDPAATDHLAGAGAETADSPCAVASSAELVFVCLPSPEISERVALGPDGVLHGTCVRRYVEMSTIGPAVLRRIGAALEGRSISLLDAPVSGGPIGAEAGRLACLVSGPRSDFEAAEPALRALCDRLFHVGVTAGQAQVLKLANNVMNAGNLVLAAEMVLMARRAGIAEDVAIEVINASTGRSRATEETFKAQILTGAFHTGGKLSIACKDAMLGVEQARSLGVECSVAVAVSALWEAAEKAGHGDEDLSRIYPIMAELSQRLSHAD